MEVTTGSETEQNRSRRTKGYEKTFIMDETPRARSATGAIWNMLKMRKIEKQKNKDTPISINTRNEKELDIEYAKRCPQKTKSEAGLSHLALKGHSLGIGGKTPFEDLGPHGAITTGFMGLWASSAKWHYMYAYQKKLEEASLKIGRTAAHSLANTLEPTSRERLKRETHKATVTE